MSDNKHGRGLGIRGYYIALIACAAVIGISSYVYYQNTQEPQADPLDTPVLASTPVDGQNDAAQSAQQPEDGTQNTTAPTGSGTRLSARLPVDGEILSDYAVEVLSYNQTTRDWRTHSGVDIAAAAGTPVMAAADGTVYTVYDDASMGMTVVIRHADGYATCYSSLSEAVSVSAGDSVTMGQAIGTVGSTALMENALGDHVHFAVTKNDEPVDPMEFVG